MKHGIITGSSRGIGLATVELLVNNSKTKVIGTSTNGNHTLIKPNFECLKLDLSSSSSIDKFVENLENVKLDFLINNAGILLEKWDESVINLKQLKDTFDINLFGTIELTESLIPKLNPKAHIINITSD